MALIVPMKEDNYATTTTKTDVVAARREHDRVGRNLDDFAVNLNTDEIPISGTERREERTRGSGLVCETLFSVDKFDDEIERGGRHRLLTILESSRRDGRYRNSNTIVKAAYATLLPD